MKVTNEDMSHMCCSSSSADDRRSNRDFHSQLTHSRECKRTRATQLALCYSNQPEPRLDGYYSSHFSAIGAGTHFWQY